MRRTRLGGGGSEATKVWRAVHSTRAPGRRGGGLTWVRFRLYCDVQTKLGSEAASSAALVVSKRRQRQWQRGWSRYRARHRAPCCLALPYGGSERRLQVQVGSVRVQSNQR